MDKIINELNNYINKKQISEKNIVDNIDLIINNLTNFKNNLSINKQNNISSDIQEVLININNFNINIISENNLCFIDLKKLIKIDNELSTNIDQHKTQLINYKKLYDIKLNDFTQKIDAISLYFNILNKHISEYSESCNFIETYIKQYDFNDKEKILSITNNIKKEIQNMKTLSNLNIFNNNTNLIQKIDNTDNIISCKITNKMWV